MKNIFTYILLFATVLLLNSFRYSAENFNIVIERTAVSKGLIFADISVNGQNIGKAFENAYFRIPPNSYNGLLRYWSNKNFVGGPFGALGKQGDFLVEVQNVPPQRSSILLHGGNQVKHSEGCILLGPVNKDPITSQPYVNDDSALRKLRLLFYGTDVPNASPDKKINITVKDKIPDGTIVSRWSGSATGKGETTRIDLTFKYLSTGLSIDITHDGDVDTGSNYSINASNRVVKFTIDDVNFTGTFSADYKSLNGNYNSKDENGTWSVSQK